MIADYKLYHGAVLAELVHKLASPVSIDELIEAGRLNSYILNGHIGMHIKHASQRLRPWPFTLTKQNLGQLLALRQRHGTVFVVFVCHTDGMVCLTLEEVIELIDVQAAEQAWIRIDRRPRQWYSISGSRKGPIKRPAGVDPIVSSLEHGASRLGQHHVTAVQL